ncbi:MAG: penicillin-binding protein 2, partial [Candidatus Uhrbacteria bacterium]
RRGAYDRRLLILLVLGICVWAAIAVRLFTVQILRRDWYSALATGQRELFQQLYPERGEIFVRDRRSSSGLFPIATNRRVYTIYAVPKDIADPVSAARSLSPVLGIEETSIVERLTKPGDPYEPLQRRVDNATRDAVLALGIRGIAAEATLERFYPDGPAMSQISGFVGEDAEGISGRYGIEGARDRVLAGVSGFLEGERDPGGRWIMFGKRETVSAQDGSDVILTIERELQLEVCRKLEAAITAYGAASGSVVIIHPTTGAIRALCGAPSFDSNQYTETPDIGRFRAPAVVAAYEPGSVFKPITMAAAIDAGVVTPATRFTDTGSVTVDGSTITNTDSRVYGDQTMADVLRFSINTGAVFVARQLGIDRFRDALDRFGFGSLSGVELGGESPGDTSALAYRRDVYLATASYGQGITVTPIQLAVAYAAIANGGKLMRPYVVAEVVASDGTIERTEPSIVRQVINSKTATVVAGMLVSVVRDGYPKRAGVSGYLIGGKTGTAQIPFSDHPGYSSDTIHTFAGVGSIDAPTFAMVVRLDRPRLRFADSTTAPLFGEIAKFILQYDGIVPRK